MRGISTKPLCERITSPRQWRKLPISWLEQWSSQRQMPSRPLFRFTSPRKAVNYWSSIHTKANTDSRECPLEQNVTRCDLIMEKCPRVISIHDDIVIYGTSEEDHDANLTNLLNVAQIEGLVLNSKKQTLTAKTLSSGQSTVLRECTLVRRRYKASLR